MKSISMQLRNSSAALILSAQGARRCQSDHSGPLPSMGASHKRWKVPQQGCQRLAGAQHVLRRGTPTRRDAGNATQGQRIEVPTGGRERADGHGAAHALRQVVRSCERVRPTACMTETAHIRVRLGICLCAIGKLQASLCCARQHGKDAVAGALHRIMRAGAVVASGLRHAYSRETHRTRPRRRSGPPQAGLPAAPGHPRMTCTSCACMHLPSFSSQA